MEKRVHLKVGDRIAFTYGNGLFYSTKKLQRNKTYEVLELQESSEYTFTRKFGQPGEHVGPNDDGRIPVDGAKFVNDDGKEIWVSLSDPDKVDDIKVHRSEVIGDILGINDTEQKK